MKGFYVSPRNPVYASIDGVLFDKTTRTLVQYPLGRTDATYAIPQGIEVIGASAFNFGRNNVSTPLRSIIIPGSVKAIGSSAFSGNVSLTEILLPESITEIGMLAFPDCTSIRSITILRGFFPTFP